MLLLSASAIFLAGCATKYQEPTSGDRARLRMIKTGLQASTSFDTYASVQLGTCTKREAESPVQRIAILDNPLVHQNISLGIPGNAAQTSKRFSEAYVRAGEPFVLDVFGMGADVHKSFQCRVTALWTPETNTDYEAVLHWGNGFCQLAISTIVTDGAEATVLKRPVNAQYLKICDK